METEFIYWHHKLPRGIEVIEVCGGEDRSGRLWRLMAEQLIAENSDDGERSISHYSSGAPFLEGENRRVSLTHTEHFLALAMRPATPDPIGESPVCGEMLGIDAERLDRQQVLRIRERFLSREELEMIPADDLGANILAWTIKEAVYKAMLTPGLDFRRDIAIIQLPDMKSHARGTARALPKEGPACRFDLFSWESEGHCLTVAFG